MPRNPRRTLDPVFETAGRFVEAALRSDDSVLTPGKPIWTLDHLQQFYHLFAEQEDLSKDTFNVKMQRQLEEAPPAVIQLAAEMLFLHSLGVSNQGAASKHAMIDPLLQMAGVAWPEELEAALHDGVAHHGIGLAHRDAYIRLLCRFMIAWKELDAERQSSLLADSGQFRELVMGLPPGADAAQRNMLLHLVFPDQFEGAASPYDKKRIAEAFAEFVSDPDADVDTRLAEIRAALTGKYGEGFNFYQDELTRQWRPGKGATAIGAAEATRTISEAIEVWYPDPDLRDAALQWLVEAVTAVHETGPGSWGLGFDTSRQRLELNLHRIPIVALTDQAVVVGLDRGLLDETTQGELGEANAGTPGVSLTLPTSGWWRVGIAALPSLAERLGPALESHIRSAASLVAVTPYCWHLTRETVAAVAAASGQDLPWPDYPDLPALAERRGWDGLVYWTSRMFSWEGFDEDERYYKLITVERLRGTRDAVRRDNPNWIPLLKKAFSPPNNLTYFVTHARFLTWAEKTDPAAALAALKAIWNADVGRAERIRGFCRNLPTEIVGGVGTRLTMAAFLLMADPTDHPPFRPTPFQHLYKLTESTGPAAGADEAGWYDTAVSFLDELRRRLKDQGIVLRDRLDAQSLVWAVDHWTEPPRFLVGQEREAIVRYKANAPVDDAGDGKTGNGGETEKGPTSPVGNGGYVEPLFDVVKKLFQAKGFRIDDETLLRYHLSLKTRGFVIVSGVSGTGKSWLARLYAQAVGAEFRLVPVAPNWNTNEDLLGFFNPVTGVFVDTDFSRFLRAAVAEAKRAEEARQEPQPYYVLLDEMNLARVEYYFAKFLSVMEARGQEGVFVELSQDERLPLPRNLYAIGTVNIDETTHGFSDKVYDRAQVIELTITRDDIKEFAGDDIWAEKLLSVWDAVKDVAPFAYRVVDEVRVYAKVAEEQGLDWEQALDHQVLQKVLPKLARADERVGTALVALKEVCGETLPLSAAKAASMLRNLEEHGFPSYF